MSEQPDRMDIHEFRTSRRRKTDNLLKEDHRDLKRFFALDSSTYRDLTAQGGLDEKTKELLGLVASTVLRCNDCIAYHCDRCCEVGWTKSELLDALNVALVVGGSITIPHIRTVWEVVEQLYAEKEAKGKAQGVSAKLAKFAGETTQNLDEHPEEAKIMLGLPERAKGRQGRGPAKPAAPVTPAAPATPPPPAAPAAAKPAPKPTPAKR
jgi:AhpD family alkylhydroperoxidase